LADQAHDYWPIRRTDQQKAQQSQDFFRQLTIKNLSVNNISTVYGMAATQSDEGCCDVVEGEAVSG